MACTVQGRPKKARQVKKNACNLTSRKLFTKNSSWRTKQSIPHTTVTFYVDSVKMCEDFAPNLGDERVGCCITTKVPSHASLLTREYLSQNNMTVVPHSPYFFLFPDLR
jgi:hypothetical protein